LLQFIPEEKNCLVGGLQSADFFRGDNKEGIDARNEVEENLSPLLQDHNIKMQALSSYVLIATNVLLCTSPPSQQNLLELVLPAILPYMTTHHHNL